MIRVAVYIDIFNDIIFSYYLTATQTLIFGCIKWTPDDAFTGSFLDIVFGQYVRLGMRKKLPPKMRNKFVVAIFHLEISPMLSCPFCDK